MRRTAATRRWVLVLAFATVAVLVVSLLLAVGRSPDVRVTASSGSSSTVLLTDGRGNVAWRTESETVGAWVELAYPQPTRVDRVQVLGAGATSIGFTSAVLTFDGGSALMLTADEAGDASAVFPPRTVTRVRLTVAEVPRGATSVALAGLAVDGSGGWASSGEDRGERVVAMTSSTAGVPASALSDGTPAEGDTGREWAAAPHDRTPWAQLSWDRPREVASVQAFGPTSAAGDHATAPLRGLLRFDDGSTLVVSGIPAGDDEATTIAFTPRIASSVRLEIDRPAPAATAGLRELVVHDAGTTPPRWPQGGTGYATSPPPAGSCQAGAAPVADPSPGELTLACPSPGSGVAGEATIVVAADPGTPLEVLVWTGKSGAGADSLLVVASATAGADGRATFTVDTSRAPRGPLTLRVQETGQDPGTPLYVQLVNLAGWPVEAAGSPPTGMTLQWAEEFTDPLSISGTGADADYAATKPDASSSGQFGEALFTAPDSGTGTLATIGREYLRIRARPAVDGIGGPSGAGHLSGIMASADVGGSGFAAQFGYFEARIMGAPGAGTWPAFWMLNTESAARQTDTEAEVDAVELYGHNTLGSCHAVHSWGVPAPTESDGDSDPHCLDRNGFADWAMAWHTYGVRITPDGAVFSIDGLEVSTARGLSHSSEPFFFVVNLALGAGWPVDLSPTGGITDMYVDWIRVYT